MECSDEAYKDFYKQKLNELTTTLSRVQIFHWDQCNKEEINIDVGLCVQVAGGKKLLAQFEKQEKLIRTLTEICQFAKKSNWSRNKKVSTNTIHYQNNDNEQKNCLSVCYLQFE